MAEKPRAPDVPDIPEAVAAPKSRRTVQLVWLIPLIAALVGGWLAVKSVLERGPTITLTFKTAQGLEAGKTKIKFKDVEIGEVKSVVLAKDHTHIIAEADINKEASSLLVNDARFWVVRPRFAGGSLSGLGTVFSGSYIGIDVGKSSTPKRDFTGLETPPPYSTDAPGREFVLRSDSLKSLDVGTPVYFRGLQVGQIATYELNKDGKGVTLKLFVEAPYDQYVNANTRFWDASGIAMSLDASGIKVSTQSLTSILFGGLAFETPAAADVLPPAESGTAFDLFADRGEAMKNPEAIVDTYVMKFNESVRGLQVGAPVDYRGIVVGEVSAIHTEFNQATGAISIPVEMRFYPERFTSLSISGPKTGRIAKNHKAMADMLVQRGLRAQLRTGSLLTGGLYITLDFFPHAAKAKIDWNAAPPEFPTTPGALDDLKKSIGDITRKIDMVDFKGISTDLRQALQSTNKLVLRLDTELAPQTSAMLEEARSALGSANKVLSTNSPLQQQTLDTMQDTRNAMQEAARAAQAIRVLSDYLERHPEALIRGKKEDEK